MVKILSQSGDSLADTYNVEGSIAGIEQLETRELPIVHEMGSTVFSERLSGAVRRGVTAAINQSTVFDIVFTDLPSGAWRVLGVTMLTNAVGRIDRAMVAMREPDAGREVPFFVWNTATDTENLARMVVEGAAATNVGVLIPSILQVPTLGIGGGQPQRVGEIACRGASGAFGAGTVVLTVLIYIGLSAVGGVPGNTTSRGLPVPSW